MWGFRLKGVFTSLMTCYVGGVDFTGTKFTMGRGKVMVVMEVVLVGLPTQVFQGNCYNSMNGTI